MLNLLKKEFALCVHQTQYIFIMFSAMVFVPNYPYEIIFFFAALSVFFCCLTARENGDSAFACILPVRKRLVPASRIIAATILQCVIMLLTCIFGALKDALLSFEMIINQAGISASVALIGNGALLLGVFNIVFFPLYYRNPDKVGLPFVAAAVTMFFVIGAFIVLRWTTPLFSTILNGRNADYTGAKLSAAAIGVAVYALLTYLSVKLSARNFDRIDL